MNKEKALKNQGLEFREDILLGGAAVFVWLKGKSTLMIFERHANLKYKYGNRHFWCRGYYVDTVWKNAKNTGIMSL